MVGDLIRLKIADWCGAEFGARPTFVTDRSHSRAEQHLSHRGVSAPQSLRQQVDAQLQHLDDDELQRQKVAGSQDGNIYPAITKLATTLLLAER